jgi:putative membrane protein
MPVGPKIPRPQPLSCKTFEFLSGRVTNHSNSADPLASGRKIAYIAGGMPGLLRVQATVWAGVLTSVGAIWAQQPNNNPSDQYTTLGRRATTINQDQRQTGVANAPNNQSTGTQGANTVPESGAGTGGPTPGTYTQPAESPTSETADDATFARRLVEHGLLKAELGKLAVQKGGSEQIRNIGQALIDDHDKWVKSLSKIAAENNIKLPDKMDQKRKAVVDRIAAASGPDFDRAFTRQVIRYQREDLSLLRDETANGTIAALRTWARKCIPGLERRVEAVQAEQASLGIVTQKHP